MRIGYKVFPLLSLCVITIGLVAQRTSVYREPEAAYRSGMDLFEKEKYGAAQKDFTFVIENEPNPIALLRVNAEYYDALCALELYNGDAEYKFTEFLRQHPSSSRVNLINYQLGRLAYTDKKFNSAQEYFEKVDESELSKGQLDEFYFKKGYCYFKTDDAAQSKALV